MDLTEFVTDLVYEPTQTEGRGLDLTVAAVYEVEQPGRVDFGGGELEDADLSAHPSEYRDPDDDYEWWHLDAGGYLIEYNESLALPADLAVTVQPHEHLLARGAFHPTVSVQELSGMPLSVAGAGLRIKENARVSTVVGAERT